VERSLLIEGCLARLSATEIVIAHGSRVRAEFQLACPPPVGPAESLAGGLVQEVVWSVLV
jgi:hypothetical protein